jgi:hypothetical protein
MVISNSQKFVFIHIPKTGGTSMTHSLEEVIAWNDIVCGGTPFGERTKEVWGQKWGIGKHASAPEIRTLIGEARWEQYFTFALVRDPVERVKSMYLWTQRVVERRGLDGWRRWVRYFSTRYQNDWTTVQMYLDTDSFAEYIRHPDLEKAMIAKPQSDFLTSERGTGDLIVDRVFRLASIHGRLDEICDRIGNQITLPQKNVSSKRRSVTVHEADIRRIEELYAKDYSILDYQRRTRAPTR